MKLLKRSIPIIEMVMERYIIIHDVGHIPIVERLIEKKLLP